MDSLTRDFQLDWACAGIAEASEASGSTARARRNLCIEISGDETERHDHSTALVRVGRMDALVISLFVAMVR